MRQKFYDTMKPRNQKCYSTILFSSPSPGDRPNPGMEPGSPALQADALSFEPPGKPKIRLVPKETVLILTIT